MLYSALESLKVETIPSPIELVSTRALQALSRLGDVSDQITQSSRQALKN
jgi:hypothetical protein